MGKIIEPTNKFCDLICQDVQCPDCNGHAVQIFPRSKYNVLWPSICLFCGEVKLSDPGLRSQDIVDLSYCQYEWAKSMTEIFSYHLQDHDQYNYFRYKLEGKDIV